VQKAFVFALVFVMGLASLAKAQDQQQAGNTGKPAAAVPKAEASPKTTPASGPATATADEKAENEDDGEEQRPGLRVPDTEKLRVGVRFMAGFGQDLSQASLGYENQGRVGYVIVSLAGKLSDRFGYLIEVNPVNETQPLPACGEAGTFYPNAPQPIGPNVTCHNDGRVRVDDYRFIALDPVMQQGPVRQAYLSFRSGPFGIKAGRFMLPIGFGWEEAGSVTAKDATHIQRINAEANFGFMIALTRRVNGRRFAEVSVAGILGAGNNYHDYHYFYGIDGSLDSNASPTMLLSAAVEPVKGLEIRGALKRGHTGSKVERLPNFHATKRNNHALVASIRYQPVKYLTVFGEGVRYTWGLMRTSAELLGLDPAPVEKNGYYVGAEASYPITKTIRVGTVITREELSRDDALIKYLAGQGLYNVTMGRKERSMVLRFYADISNTVRVGVYRNDLSNPFPWVSGIAPVSGQRAYQGRGNDKYGVTVQFRLQ